mgnify:CR=1 FL=1
MSGTDSREINGFRIISPPSRIAVTPSPGIPSVRRGTMAPPQTALFAHSDVMTPSTSPFPKVSGCFEKRLVRS